MTGHLATGHSPSDGLPHDGSPSDGSPSDGPHRGHAHGVRAGADGRCLAVALTLLAAFLIVEVVVAVAAGSLALLSDAGHLLTDVGAIAASLWAIRLAARPSKGRLTFGWKRAEILSALGNGVTLLVVSVLVAVEAIRRLIHPPAVAGGAVLIVAIIGVAVNLLAAWTMAKADRTSLNVEGAYQHVVTDLYGFLGTAVAGLIVLTTGYERADPIASLLVVALMLRAAWSLLRESGAVLLEAAPDQVDLDEMRSHLLEVDHVTDVHDLHVWTVTSSLPALSAHVVVDTSCFHDGHAPQLLDQLQACVAGHFDVEHSTFQLELGTHAEHESAAH